MFLESRWDFPKIGYLILGVHNKVIRILLFRILD